MNLILPDRASGEAPGRMPLWTNTQFETLQFEQIEPYLRGRVSYIRALDTGARKVSPQGTIKPTGYQTSIYPCDMSAFQYAAYLRSNQTTGRQTRQAFYGEQRQASNFVFPDGTWGIPGWNKYVELRDGKHQFRPDQNGQYLRGLVRSNEGLQTLSAKYAEIVQICRESYPPDRTGTTTWQVEDHQGVIFIYFPVYVNGSGSVMAGLCLEEHGYEEYRESRSIFMTSTARGSGGPCGSYGGNAREEREFRISRRPRYVSLTNRTTSAQFVSMFEAINSYENRYGEIIQVVIVSKIGQEGISINNAVGELITSSSWNAARNGQAEDRIFRSTSHDIRLEEKRRRVTLAGGDPTTVTIDVRVYNMASIYVGDPELTDPNQSVLRETNYNTVDAQMYLLSEQKNRAIRKVIRFCKMAAFDCHTNYRRNVRPADVDGSAACDYGECNYTCSGIRADLMATVDRTTKILFYSQAEVGEATKSITGLFSRYSSMKIDQIHRQLSSIDPIFIDMALEEMIRENTRITDRMGFFGYLREAPDSTIFVESDPFTIQSLPENTVYTSVLIGTQDPRNNIFADYVTNLEAITQAPQLEELIQVGSAPNGVRDPRFTELLEELALSNKVILLEYVLLQRKTTGQTNDFFNAIISGFSHSIFEVNEPIASLQQAAFALANRGKGRGRKPNPNTKLKAKALKTTVNLSEIQFPTFTGGAPEQVIIHTLFNQAFERTSYNTLSKFFKAEGKLRILKPSEGIGWRDVNQYEQIVYNNLVQNQIGEIRAYYEQFPIYGIMIPPMNQLRIRDKDNEDPSRAQSDARFFRTGKVCGTWYKHDLVSLLYRLGVRLPEQPAPTFTRDQIIDYLITQTQNQSVTLNLQRFDNDQLVFFYNWYRTGLGKDDLCAVLRQHLERTGKIFTGKMPQALMNRPMPSGPASGTLQTVPASKNPTKNSD